MIDIRDLKIGEEDNCGILPCRYCEFYNDCIINKIRIKSKLIKIGFIWTQKI